MFLSLLCRDVVGYIEESSLMHFRVILAMPDNSLVRCQQQSTVWGCVILSADNTVFNLYRFRLVSNAQYLVIEQTLGNILNEFF